MPNPLEEENKPLQTHDQAFVVKPEEQIAIKKQYEESQLQFKTIFEQSRFGCKIITADLLIVQVNPALQAMLGYSAAELVGTKITTYCHPDFLTHWNELQVNLWTKQIPSFQLETCLIKKNGDVLWCSVTSILFTNQEAKLGYTTLEDISVRKGLEEKLQKHADMINTDLENFVYTASHELKSPITNIEALTGMLQKRLLSKYVLDEEHTSLLTMISSSVDKLKTTIHYLTDMARVQKEEVEDEIVSISELIEEVYQELTVLIADSEIILLKHIEVEELRMARKNIRSILHNLLSNAIKYCSPKRKLEIRITTRLEAGLLVLTVEDNGIGIAENHLKKVFTMFRRFHTHVDGTGIGLYISKRLVENMHGRIEVE